jgi:hypothetical protein
MNAARQALLRTQQPASPLLRMNQHRHVRHAAHSAHSGHRLALRRNGLLARGLRMCMNDSQNDRSKQ